MGSCLSVRGACTSTFGISRGNACSCFYALVMSLCAVQALKRREIDDGVVPLCLLHFKRSEHGSRAYLT